MPDFDHAQFDISFLPFCHLMRFYNTPRYLELHYVQTRCMEEKTKIIDLSGNPRSLEGSIF